MSDVTEKWRTERVTAAIYDAGVNPKYLRHGEVVEAAVATDDGAIDLGAQRNVADSVGASSGERFRGSEQDRKGPSNGEVCI
jgi:hypothetical protein